MTSKHPRAPPPCPRADAPGHKRGLSPIAHSFAAVLEKAIGAASAASLAAKAGAGFGGAAAHGAAGDGTRQVTEQ